MARSASRTPFVARGTELDRFRAMLEYATAGRPGTILLAGDAGVGKTRLIGQMAEIAAERGAAVVIGHCVDMGDVGLPYHPFTDALIQLRSIDQEVEAVVAARPALHRLLDGGATELLEGPDQQTARLRLFDAFAAVLAAAARPDRPLVLILEDLHWADSSSRDVLRFLLSRLQQQRLLIVATYRTDDLHRRHPLRPVLAELLRHPTVEHIELAPFTEPELADFAAAVTGTQLPDRTVQRVLERSEGNAYFAEELLESGPRIGPLPGSLADVLRSRVERLEPAAQRLAQIASVAGRRVAEPLLRIVARHDDSLVDASAFDRALREAVTHHVLVAEEDGTVAFRHALLAEAVYGDLLPGEQVRAHRAYLRTLTEEPDLGSQAEIAHHALRSHDLPAALVASFRASCQARDLLAPVEELGRLESVLELWDAVPDAESLIGVDRVAVEMSAASAASRAGQPSRAATLARSALAASDPARAARLTPAAAFYLIDDNHADQALERAAQALTVLDTQAPTPERARLLAAHARAAVNLDLDDVARQSADRAVEESRTLGVADAEADALATLAILEVDDADAAAELLRLALTRARDAEDLLTELRIAHNLTSTLYYAARLEDASRVAEEGIARARDTGVIWMGYGVGMLLFRELIRYTRGDLSPAPPVRSWIPESALLMFAVLELYGAVARGDPEMVERARAVHVDWERDPWMALLSGGCTIDAYTWVGDHAAAVDLTVELIDFMGRTWNDYFLGGIWLSALGLAALADRAERDRLTGSAAQQDLDLGAVLVTRAVETAERGRPRGGRLGPEGRAWLARARAEYGRLTGDDHPDNWRDVITEFGYGHRYELARSRWRLAGALAAAGDRDAAAAEAATALREARDLDAKPLIDAIVRLGRRTRLDLADERRPGAVLTEREEEVLRLVAQGLTNRQVGTRLFISPKTVSVHISNVLGKLGVSGRTEAVAVAHQRGLLDISVGK